MAKGESNRGKRFVGIDTTMVRPKVTPPKELSRKARVYWRRIVDNVPNDYFNPSDFAVLVAYCKNYEILIEAQDMIDEQGAVLTDEQGKLYKNPWFVVLQEVTGKITTLATKVRLCPSARMKNDRVKEKVPDGVATTKLGALLRQ